jgi:hypothetical protein
MHCLVIIPELSNVVLTKGGGFTEKIQSSIKLQAEAQRMNPAYNDCSTAISVKN